MRLSKRGRYGVRAMVCLALHGSESPVSTRRIAAEEHIPVPFLEQLLFSLKKAGIVRSVRGPKGGFLLTRSPKRIQVLDVLEALGETVHPSECVAADHNKSECEHIKRCPSHLLWHRLDDKVREVLGNTTLFDMCGDARELGKEDAEPSDR